MSIFLFCVDLYFTSDISDIFHCICADWSGIVFVPSPALCLYFSMIFFEYGLELRLTWPVFHNIRFIRKCCVESNLCFANTNVRAYVFS